MLFRCLRKMLNSDVLRGQKIQYSHILNYLWHDLFMGVTDKKYFNSFQRYLLEL